MPPAHSIAARVGEKESSEKTCRRIRVLSNRVFSSRRTMKLERGDQLDFSVDRAFN